MATHSSILAWKLSWTEEPGGLQSMESQRVWHNWATNTYLLPWQKLLWVVDYVQNIWQKTDLRAERSHITCPPSHPGWLQSKRRTVTSVGEEAEKSELARTAGAAAWKDGLATPQKVKHRVTTWPRQSTPRYLPKTNGKAHIKMCPRMFTAALFTIAPQWKQVKYPSVDEWINKMWSVWALGCYCPIKRDGQAMTWVNFENILLSERSQVTKDPHIVRVHLYEMSRIETFTETENRLMVARAGGKGDRRGVTLKDIWFLWKVFCSYTVLMIIYPCEYVKKKCWIAHFKIVNFNCELYLNNKKKREGQGSEGFQSFKDLSPRKSWKVCKIIIIPF